MYQGQFEERRSSLYARPDNNSRVIGLYNERSITGGYEPKKKVDAYDPKVKRRKCYFLDLWTGIIAYCAPKMAQAINRCESYIGSQLDKRILKDPDKGVLEQIKHDMEASGHEWQKPEVDKLIKVKYKPTGKVYKSIRAAAQATGINDRTIRYYISVKCKPENRIFERV
jgi:hypothetical protein